MSRSYLPEPFSRFRQMSSAEDSPADMHVLSPFTSNATTLPTRCDGSRQLTRSCISCSDHSRTMRVAESSDGTIWPALRDSAAGATRSHRTRAAGRVHQAVIGLGSSWYCRETNQFPRATSGPRSRLDSAAQRSGLRHWSHAIVHRSCMAFRGVGERSCTVSITTQSAFSRSYRSLASSVSGPDQGRQDG